MRSGHLRRLARILKQEAGGRDALNHPLPATWTEVGETRCAVEYQYKPSERRDARASTVVGSASAWITMRYRPGIERTMRIEADGSLWDIVDVQPDERHRMMRLFCEKVVSEGSV